MSNKKQAFKSFLETNTSSKVESKKNLSDHEEVYEEEYTQKSTNCTVCGDEVPEAASSKKNCGFCQQVACGEHLRKRRKKKNKWEKICDSCEDKFLFDNYMKLEIKAEEALAVEEEIITMKLEDTRQVLQNKRAKRRELAFDYESMTRRHDDKMLLFMKEDSKLQSLSNKIESEQILCHQMEQYIHRMENKIKCNYEEDHRILTEEDNRLGSELSRVDRKCSQVRSAIEKREKELEQAYENWERQQYGRVQQQRQNLARPPEKDCAIF